LAGFAVGSEQSFAIAPAAAAALASVMVTKRCRARRRAKQFEIPAHDEYGVVLVVSLVVSEMVEMMGA